MADTADDTERYVPLPRLNSTGTKSSPNISSTRDKGSPRQPFSSGTNAINTDNGDSKSILSMDNSAISDVPENSISSTKSNHKSHHGGGSNDQSSMLQDSNTRCDGGMVTECPITENSGESRYNEKFDVKPTSLDDASLAQTNRIGILGTDGQANQMSSNPNKDINIREPFNNLIRYSNPADSGTKPMPLVPKDAIGYGGSEGKKHNADIELSLTEGKQMDEFQLQDPNTATNGLESCTHGDNEDPQRAPAPLPSSPPDGGWGWVVCFTCLWVNGTVMGTVNTFGILYNHMREMYAQGDEEVSLKTCLLYSETGRYQIGYDFKHKLCTLNGNCKFKVDLPSGDDFIYREAITNKKKQPSKDRIQLRFIILAFVGSCMNGVMFLMSCVSGILCDVIGLRHTALIGGVLCVIGFLSSAFVSQLELLYLTYGVILGSGFGLVFSPMVAISGHYFKKHIGLVNGIVTFGASAFTVAMSFALPLLLTHFGLRETLLSFAGLGVTLTLCTLTWKPLISREVGNANSEETGSACKHCLGFVSRKVLNGRVWRNRRFLCWSLAMSVSRFGYLEPYFHMVDHVSHILPGSNSSILITIMAAVSGVSKLGVGLLSDQIKNYRIYFQQGALLVYGIIVLCIPFSGTFPGFIAIAVFLGLADAVIMALFGPNAIQLVGPGNASQAVGFASLIAIPTFLSAPAITGTMHDHLESYNVGFHVTGAITLLSSFLMCLVANPFEKHNDKSKSSPTLTGHSGSSRRESSHAYVNSAFKGKETNNDYSESQFGVSQRYDNQLYDTSDVPSFDSDAIVDRDGSTNHNVGVISAVGEKDGTTNHNISDINDVGHVGHVNDGFYRNVADIKSCSDIGQRGTTRCTDIRL